MSTGTHQYDLAVVGAGSGGIGAAVAAARAGLRVVLIEKADVVGGNAVRGGVHTWEMTAGATGIPFDIYRRLRRIPLAVGVYSIGRHICWPAADGSQTFYGGESVIDPQRRYIDSLRRHGTRGFRGPEHILRETWHGVPFEPEHYCAVVEQMLAETGCCTLLKRTAFTKVHTDGSRITALELDNGTTVTARAYVDGTADGLLCIACGCETISGQESRDTFDEPGAPETANDMVNAVTLVYRVTPTDAPRVEPTPRDIPEDCWWAARFPVVSCTQYPNGDRNMNMLPTMEGREFLRQPYAAAYAECRRRVLAHWRFMQQRMPEFQAFALKWIAPGLGVRETQRIVGEYVLTEHDLLAGMSGQRHEDIIAITDHAMDTHGGGNRRGGCGDLPGPYGVPYRCLIPRGWRNLLIACRAASMSSIAASSCRLSRTMMQLGQAAGAGAALAARDGVDLPDVSPVELRAALRRQHAQVDWPTPADLLAHLRDEDAP